MTTLNDTLSKLNGQVEIVQTNEQTGEQRVIRCNLVVDVAYENLASLLSGSFTNRQVSRIYFGKGTTAAAAGDTTITFLSSHTSVVVTAAYPVVYSSVVFTGVWGAAEADAESVTELGLFFANNVLCSRVVFDSMKKSVGWTWTITWTLQYSV